MVLTINYRPLADLPNDAMKGAMRGGEVLELEWLPSSRHMYHTIDAMHWALLCTGPVGPIHLLGPVGAIHLLDPVASWGHLNKYS